jgi:hypothetical protein
MAPLSGKQQREYLKFQNKEAREVSKMGLDEMRKQQLHELKLQEAAAKANQGLGHKQQVNNAKLKDMGVPLPKSASISKQKLGIPSMNPMAGTEMFKQGQHKLPQSTVFQARGTDTVPAMLTPGEAVIPRAAAQDPKNKKAIRRMVQEGRKANAMRDGAVDVRYSDAPGQAKYHADGTSGVPSLAYRHSDVPGSSFMHGTMSVPDFSRGSSAQANYNNGTYGVVPQQVQSAAGYQLGTVDADIDEERKRQNVVPMIIQPTVENIPVWDERYPKDKAEEFANAVAIDRRPPTEAVSTPVIEAPPSNAVTTSREVPPVNLNTTVPVPSVSVVPAIPDRIMKNPLGSTELQSETISVPPQVTEAPVVVAQTPVAPLAAAPAQMTTEQLIERDKANTQNTPVAVAVPTVPPKEGTDPTFVSGVRKDYETDPVKASRKIRSVAEIVEELSGTQKTEKSFTDSLANLFTASGFKEELGLNNQDIIRMAISTAVGAKKFGVNRALAFAGRQAFEESSKRNAQQQAEAKAIRAAAVQIRGQEIKDVRAEENTLSAEKRAVQRENARYDHERFKAEQASKMQQAKEEFERTRDDKKFQQQLQILASQQSQQDKRMVALMGNQWAMMEYKEERRANSPQEILNRYIGNTEKAANEVESIYKREFGAEDVKDKPNPDRKGIPTSKQISSQSASYLRRAGIDVSNPDVFIEAKSVINLATMDMINDKRSGRVDAVTNIEPYLARNIMVSRLKLPEELLNVGKKNTPMPAEKLTTMFAEVRSLAKDPETGKANKLKEEEIANEILAEWNGPNGKDHRKRYSGTENESAFAQFMQASLTKLKAKPN